MTPCEERGYKVGDLFTVLADRNGFRTGTIVKLETDDGSMSPLFSGENSTYKATIAGVRQGAAFLLLDYVGKFAGKDAKFVVCGNSHQPTHYLNIGEVVVFTGEISAAMTLKVVGGNQIQWVNAKDLKIFQEDPKSVLKTSDLTHVDLPWDYTPSITTDRVQYAKGDLAVLLKDGFGWEKGEVIVCGGAISDTDDSPFFVSQKDVNAEPRRIWTYKSGKAHYVCDSAAPLSVVKQDLALVQPVEVKEEKKRELVFRSPVGSAVVTYKSGATFHITKLIGVEVFGENVKVSRQFKRKGLTHEESVYIPVDEFASLVYKGAQGTMTLVLNESGTAFTHTQITHFTKLEI